MKTSRLPAGKGEEDRQKNERTPKRGYSITDKRREGQDRWIE
jgi:hypothetical protein